MSLNFRVFSNSPVEYELTIFHAWASRRSWRVRRSSVCNSGTALGAAVHTLVVWAAELCTRGTDDTFAEKKGEVGAAKVRDVGSRKGSFLISVLER